MNATDKAQRRIAAVADLKRRGWPPEETARRLKVSEGTVRSWLSDAALPSGRRLDDLERLLERKP